MATLSINGFTAKVCKDRTISCATMAGGGVVDVQVVAGESPKKLLSRLQQGGAVMVFVQRARYVRYMLRASMVERSGTIYDTKIYTLVDGKWDVKSDRKNDIY